MLGFLGYGVATALGVMLAQAWNVAQTDRLIAFVVPPMAFLIVVSAVRRRIGRERIVFYQTATAGVVAATVASALTGGDAARVCDVAVTGIAAFLVFGRLGCFSVACCYGRPARRGVVYGSAHVAVGFPRCWEGRTLWPTQIVESVATLTLVVAALAAGWTSPGTPALVVITGYAPVRFALELVRGDAARPYALGVSEAQWTSVATAIACAVWRPGTATVAIAGAVSLCFGWLVVRRAPRALILPAHVRELEHATAATVDGQRHVTSLGVAVSRHPLPDGRTDFVLSSAAPHWSPLLARQLAALVWIDHELVAGQAAPVVHVIVRGA